MIQINMLDLLLLDEEKKSQLITRVIRPILTSLGLPTARITVETFSGSGNFQSVTAGVITNDYVFDIGNPALGVIPLGNESSNALYIGSLITNTFISAYAGPATCGYTNWISTGRNGALSQFPLKSRQAIVAVDVNIEAMSAGGVFTSGFVQVVPVIPFNYLRLRHFQGAGGGGQTVIYYYMFTGIKVNYTG